MDIRLTAVELAKKLELTNVRDVQTLLYNMQMSSLGARLGQVEAIRADLNKIPEDQDKWTIDEY